MRHDSRAGGAASPAAPSTGPGANAHGAIWGSLAYRRLFLGMLALSYLVNFMDRQVLSILIEPIKAELHLADWQLGTLGGIAFALFYVTLGLPIAKLSDRYNRVNIIAIALTVWSLATAACGLAAGFFHLLLARIGVAVGESAGTPPAYSLIADLYEPRRRAGATGVFVAAPAVGTACGLLFGGWLGANFGWRTAFIVVAIPGLLLAVAMKLVLREPPRGFAEGRPADGEASRVGAVARLLATRPSFPAMALAAGIASFSGYAMHLWLPSFFIRSHGMPVEQAGAWLALMHLAAGVFGGVAGGQVADRLGRRDPRWWMLVPCVAMLIAVPLAFLAFSTDSRTVAMIATTGLLVMYGSWAGPVYAAAQGLVGLRMRAVTISLLLFVINLIGLGLGPPLVGWASDLLQQRAGADSLRLALLGTAPLFALSAALYFLASRTLQRDLDAAPA
ncbi:MAG: spinster family MFS transporter [Gammaproteobacteria bacterium]